MTVSKSREEISLRCLLNKCELRGRDFAFKDDWRLPKYVTAAEKILATLYELEIKPDTDSLNEYNRRIDFLKKLIDSKKETPIERIVAGNMVPHTVPSSSDQIIKEIQQKTTTKYINDVRKELFSSEKDFGLRSYGEKMSGDDLNAVLKQQQGTQEKITEEMVSIARTLKDQSQLVNRVIRKDIETLNKSDQQMNSNHEKLKAEAAILAEHLNRAWKCWLWVILVVVMIVFIGMVLLMKVVTKG